MSRCLTLVTSLLCVLALAFWPCSGRVRASPEKGQPYAPVLQGKAVSFGLSGFEPDFDPLYHVVISATLHDRRPAGVALPDAVLILSSYLEVFQPDTTPVLPDLLHPDQAATALAGFLQGKAALVNAAGHVVYRGSLLAEIVLDNAVHIVLRLYDVEESDSAPPLQLRGMLTLYKGGTQRGWLRAAGPLALAALTVPRGPAPSWQSVVGSLSVAVPRMMGTPGQHHGRGATRCNVGTRLVPCAARQKDQPVLRAAGVPHKQRAAPERRGPVVVVMAVALGAALVLAVAALLLWRQAWHRTHQPRRSRP
jgi:hypothetical protein